MALAGPVLCDEPQGTGTANPQEWSEDPLHRKNFFLHQARQSNVDNAA